MALTAATACDDAWNYDDRGGEGTVSFTTTVRSDVKVASRAVKSQQDLFDGPILWISNDKGVVRKYDAGDRIPASIPLVAGRYSAEAWTGDSVAASFDARWFHGLTEFYVEGGKSTNVDLVCKIANVVVSVQYDDNVAEVLSDYSMTVGHSGGTITFEGNDTRKGYFMMNSRAKDLTYTINGTLADGSEYSRTETLVAPKSATEYVLHVKYNPNDQSVGGGYFTIEIDESEVVVEDEIVISMAPVIKGIGFNLAEPVVKEAGTVGRRSVYISASADLKSVILESEYLNSLVGMGGGDFDLMGMTDDVRLALADNGVNFVYSYNEADDISNIKLNFEPELTDALTDGSYTFSLTATDANNKTTSAVLDIQINDQPVHTVEVALADIWAKSVTLYGTQTQDGATNVMFNYRARGTQAWTQAAPTASESRTTTYKLELDGLEPATAYEYTLSCTDADGNEFISDDIKTFTTAAAPQLPNAGFEEWNTGSKAYLICNSENEMFWDSGNHGSATMNKNVTVPATDVKHSGERSVKLQSQFVGVGTIGAFAAGNIFVGKFLGTDGTDGILGWGREFTARPKALKGYVKYVPATIDNNKKAPDDIKAQYPIGDMDRGIVYIALLDGSKAQSTNDYPQWPVVVKTKSSSRHLFDKDSSDVIAYGELELTEATAGDGMIEFTIPLDYRRTDLIPSSIVVTASASKGGDYFCGGPSVMYLDDFELVY